ncbi:hypothetical protein L9F63_022529 [Diploptera punctata]|uniref:Uncharacterized protein n=1 Tax=Diploptera punctata TaxID=6984 RepID=A0AAD7ZMB2_DIPPU|nr:hypothetical protein L9F63_022529 [Diploptera punctata]
MTRGLTIEEALAELGNCEVDEDDMNDIQLAIIPPLPDELTDEEDIEENTLVDSVVRDVVCTLELIILSDEYDIPNFEHQNAVDLKKNNHLRLILQSGKSFNHPIP